MRTLRQTKQDNEHLSAKIKGFGKSKNAAFKPERNKMYATGIENQNRIMNHKKCV